MFEIELEEFFAAAHSLREYEGNCERLHGHNWKVRLILAARRQDQLGMVIDFRRAKRVLDEVLGALDHQYLNDLQYFKEQNPTTENVARYVYDEVAKRLPEGVMVKRVTAWESERCAATYFEEGQGG